MNTKVKFHTLGQLELMFTVNERYLKLVLTQWSVSD